MPVGLSVYNDSGTILIDSTFANMALRHKLTATTSAALAWTANIRIAKVTFEAQSPVVAIASSVLCTLVGLDKIDSVNWTATIACFSTVNVSVSLYVFDSSAVFASGSDLGLQVFNEAGQLVFDGVNKAMCVVGFPALDISSGTWPRDFTFSASRTYATILTHPLMRDVVIPSFPYPEHIYFLMHQSISGGIRFDFFEVGGGNAPGPGGNYVSPSGNALIIDVTGY